MSEKVERALEIVRSFSEAEFHSFMEMLYISESSQSSVSFNDLIGKNRFKNGIIALVSGTGKTSTDKVKAVLENRIAETSVLVTDKESSYRRFARENNIELIQIKAEQRTFKGIYHIQHINAFHSRLKSFMRPFQGVSTKHLNNYLVWYAWMQMNRELSEESLERNILNSSTSHNFRLLTSEISKKPVLPMAA